jgi:hypothetical protein
VSVAGELCCALIAGHFQKNDTNTNMMMPISRQMAAILVTGSFIQTPGTAAEEDATAGRTRVRFADSSLLRRDLEDDLDFSLRRA